GSTTPHITSQVVQPTPYADSLSIGGVTSNTSRITEATYGMIMIARMMPAHSRPMPSGAPANNLSITGTWPIEDCNAGWMYLAKIGENTSRPHMPYTIDGIAASNSIAVPSGRRNQAGDSSVRKSAMPKLTGTAINSAITDVTMVP